MIQPLSEKSSGRSGGNALVSVLGLSAQQLAGFVITLLAAGFLSAAEYGVYTLAIVFTEFVVMLTYTGFFHFVVNSEAEEDQVLPTMFWVMLGIGVIGGGFMIVFADMIAAFFAVPDLALILKLFGLMQPFASVIGWASACLTRAGLMRRYFLILIATNACALLAGCVVLIIWQSLYALVLYRATRIVFSIVLFGFAVPTWPRFRFNTTLFGAAWRYAVGLYGARTLTFFSMFGTDLILAYLFSTAESGLYRFANRLATAAVDIIAQPLRSFALKSFGHAARNGTSLTPIFAMYFSSTLFLVGGFALTVFVLGGGVIGAFFRPEYLLAVGAVQAFSLRACAQVGQNMIEPTFSATKRTKFAFYNNLIIALAMLITILGFAPFGFVALAWAQAVLQVVSVPLSLWIISRWSPIEIGAGVRDGLRGLMVLFCYGVALWCAHYVMHRTALDAQMMFFAGIGSAIVLGVLASGLAYRIGILKPAIFSDRPFNGSDGL